MFHSPSCHECVKVKSEVIPEIEKKFKDKIKIEYYDINVMENYKMLLSLKEKYDPRLKIVLPVFFMNGAFLSGANRVNALSLDRFINKARSVSFKETAGAASVDLAERFKNFEFLAVTSAALIDGINPCAFTVIVFFISFLALQGYKKKDLIIIGLSFIFSVFLTYLLLGVGLFGFLYQLRGFQLFTRIFNFAIGILSIALGCAALYDFYKFKKTGATEGLVLQLPAAIKNRIHSIIGMHYRKTKEKGIEAVSTRHIFRLSVSALVTGFLVSILEAVCTGQVYLPTITFMLKSSPMKLQAFGYLLWYNILFVVPLLVIFIFALLGVTSEQFSAVLKKHILTIKALMALLFFALGAFLLWRA
jgi:hypothetical protein